MHVLSSLISEFFIKIKLNSILQFVDLKILPCLLDDFEIVIMLN